MARSESVKSRREAISHVDSIDPLFATFGKPTQIYRYLKTRFTKSPLFLHRTLSYMKGRCTRRSNKVKRDSFKINDMMAALESKNKEREYLSKLENNEHLIIGFISFNDESLDVMNVTVETYLEKSTSKRRKDTIQGQPNIDVIGKSVVSVNKTDTHADKIPAVCISKNDFNKLGDSGQMSYTLSFNVRTNNPIQRKEMSGNHASKQMALPKRYMAELEIFDSNGSNLIINGIYELSAFDGAESRSQGIQIWQNVSSKKRVQDWTEDVNECLFASEDEDSNPFAAYEKNPKIHLFLEWSKKELTEKYINKPKIMMSDQLNNNNKENMPLPLPVEKQQNGHLNGIAKREKPFIIQFVVNAATKQRTEESYEYVCPWCILKCPHLFGMVKHLKLSHSRLSFQFVDEGLKSRIDVFLNDMYDGSYSGAPHNSLHGPSKGPTRRSVVTNIMVFRPRRPTFNMSEFQENDDSCFDQQHQYISGHNRIYYHSETCVPILPIALDYDSEGEPDPEWLQRTTKQMIDEFTDVNDGEKNLMKLWNLHVMKHLFVGDSHIPIACEMFVNEKGQELLKQGLRNNYLLHLDTLRGHGLISASFLNENMQQLDKLQHKIGSPEEMKKHRELCVLNWMSRVQVPGKKEKKIVKKPEPISPSKRRSENRVAIKSVATPKTADENGSVSKRKRSSN